MGLVPILYAVIGIGLRFVGIVRLHLYLRLCLRLRLRIRLRLRLRIRIRIGIIVGRDVVDGSICHAVLRRSIRRIDRRLEDTVLIYHLCLRRLSCLVTVTYPQNEIVHHPSVEGNIDQERGIKG